METNPKKIKCILLFSPTNIMILLTDNEFFEGILGGFAWIIAMYYVKHSLKEKGQANFALVGLVSWSILWYFRKIGMRLYKDGKKIIKFKDKDFDSDRLGESTLYHHFFINMFFIVLIYFIIIRKAPVKTYNIMKLSGADAPLFAFLALTGILVFFT